MSNKFTHILLICFVALFSLDIVHAQSFIIPVKKDQSSFITGSGSGNVENGEIPTSTVAREAYVTSGGVLQNKDGISCNDGKDPMKIGVVYVKSDNGGVPTIPSSSIAKVYAQCCKKVYVNNQPKRLCGVGLNDATHVVARVYIQKSRSWLQSVTDRISQAFEPARENEDGNGKTNRGKSGFFMKEFMCELSKKAMAFFVDFDKNGNATIKTQCGESNTDPFNNDNRIADLAGMYDDPYQTASGGYGNADYADPSNAADDLLNQPPPQAEPTDHGQPYQGDYDDRDKYDPYGIYDNYLDGLRNSTGTFDGSDPVIESEEGEFADGEDDWGEYYDDDDGNEEFYMESSDDYDTAIPEYPNLSNEDTDITAEQTPDYAYYGYEPEDESVLKDFTGVDFDDMDLIPVDYPVDDKFSSFEITELRRKYPGWESIFYGQSFEEIQYAYPNLTKEDYDLMNAIYVNNAYAWDLNFDTLPEPVVEEEKIPWWKRLWNWIAFWKPDVPETPFLNNAR